MRDKGGSAHSHQAASLRREKEELLARLAHAQSVASLAWSAADLAAAQARSVVSTCRTVCRSRLAALAKVHAESRALVEAHNKAIAAFTHRIQQYKLAAEAGTADVALSAENSAHLARQLADETKQRVQAQAALAALRAEKFAGDETSHSLLADITGLQAALADERETSELARKECFRLRKDHDATDADRDAALAERDAALARIDALSKALADQHAVVATVEDELALAQAQVEPLRSRNETLALINARLTTQVKTLRAAVPSDKLDELDLTASSGVATPKLDVSGLHTSFEDSLKMLFPGANSRADAASNNAPTSRSVLNALAAARSRRVSSLAFVRDSLLPASTALIDELADAHATATAINERNAELEAELRVVRTATTATIATAAASAAAAAAAGASASAGAGANNEEDDNEPTDTASDGTVEERSSAASQEAVAAAQARIDELLVMQAKLSDALKAAASRAQTTELVIARLTAQLHFAQEESRAARLSTEPAPTGSVALMFTDVLSSTKQWAANPQVMSEALTLHNALIRSVLASFGGYEVKTEGDAFMVAFSSPRCAVAAALAIQEQLLEVDWPPELLENPASAVEMADDDGIERVIYRGLRVRIGIHYGEPMDAPDPITKRMDYFGPMVNLAARVESVAQGGQVVVSNALLDQLAPEFLSSVVVSELGKHELKGIPQPIVLHAIATELLALRTFEDPAAVAAAMQAAKEAKAAKTLAFETASTSALVTHGPPSQLGSRFATSSLASALVSPAGMRSHSVAELRQSLLNESVSMALSMINSRQPTPSPMFSVMATELQEISSENKRVEELLANVSSELRAMSHDTVSLQDTIREVATFTAAAASPVISLPRDLVLDGLDFRQLQALQRQHLWIREQAGVLQQWIDALEETLRDYRTQSVTNAEHAELRTSYQAAQARIAQQRKLIKTLKAAVTAQAREDAGLSSPGLYNSISLSNATLTATTSSLIEAPSMPSLAQSTPPPKSNPPPTTRHTPDSRPAPLASVVQTRGLVKRASTAWLARMRASALKRDAKKHASRSPSSSSLASPTTSALSRAGSSSWRP
ncbi:uncharacterized protein AMSG_11718 [Thecamonas trahens ATCC 50062]|uniref:Guanylate cyclase domain-containing protein n=1 Tax=Thecamonas trahens ATCC 50062 TaxID=461836 RepID=A0A0L0D5X7_THETB|nr:hypothetical protein AMSG_11718 [Thecamonas trahens ATCC 50062]KNC47580.1 hypothetical protein AMSG_11718 [Thecamonas trahens ATCC 50062]|eukprot:XP_013759562.1 hypothetical protein AMSG_11718 [Thecamonas trahens ATCC 50062]